MSRLLVLPTILKEFESLLEFAIESYWEEIQGIYSGNREDWLADDVRPSEIKQAQITIEEIKGLIDGIS